MDSRMPTAEEARAELEQRRQDARAELALRAQEKQQQAQQKQESQDKFNYVTGAQRTPMDLPVDVAQGVVKGLGYGGAALGNLPSIGKGTYIQDTKNAMADVDQLAGLMDPVRDFGLRKNPKAKESMGGDIAQGVSKYLPYGMGAGAATEALAGPGAGWLAHLIGQTAGGAVGGAALTQPDSENNGFGLLPNGKFGGALEGALANLIGFGGGRLLGWGANALRPSTMFRGNMSPEELQQALQNTRGTPEEIAAAAQEYRLNNPPPVPGPESFPAKQGPVQPGQVPINVGENQAAQREYERKMMQHAIAQTGTRTPLGNVIENPTLKRQTENILPYSPFSGEHDRAQANARAIQQRGTDLLSTIGEPVNPEAAPTQLQNALRTATREATNEKNAMYDHVDDLADAAGVTVGRENFQRAAQSAFMQIEQSPELRAKLPASFIQELERYRLNPEGNTLKNSNIFKGHLNAEGKKLKMAGDKHQGNVLQTLARNLGTDIEEAIENSGSTELKSAYDTAQANFANNYRHFEDKDIVKATKPGADADLMLNAFIKSGKNNDRGILLQKLTEKLSPEDRHLPLQMYLNKAVEGGELDPRKLRTLYRDLGPKQKNALIHDPVLRQNLENYIDLVSRNTNDFDTMFNPKTGQRGLDLSVKTVGTLASLPMAGAPLFGGNIISRTLRSPSVREKLIQKMLERDGALNINP